MRRLAAPCRAAGAWGGWLLVRRPPREPHMEGRSLAPLALHRDLAAEQVAEALAQDETQAGGAFLAEPHGVPLRERLEDVLALLLGDADTFVRHRELDPVAAVFREGPGAQLDLPAVGEAIGVRE